MERFPADDIQPGDERDGAKDAVPPLVAAFRRHFGSMRGQVRLLEGDWTDPTGVDWGYDDAS